MPSAVLPSIVAHDPTHIVDWSDPVAALVLALIFVPVLMLLASINDGEWSPRQTLRSIPAWQLTIGIASADLVLAVIAMVAITANDLEVAFGAMLFASAASLAGLLTATATRPATPTAETDPTDARSGIELSN